MKAWYEFAEKRWKLDKIQPSYKLAEKKIKKGHTVGKDNKTIFKARI